MPKFEEFSRKSAGRTNQPKVTIQKGGTMSLNAAAAALLRLEGESEEDPIPVVLLYHEGSKTVGMRRASGSPNAYMVRKQPASVSYIVSGQAFTKFYGIDTSVARRYDAEMFDDVLGFSLEDDFQEVGRGTRKEDDE